MLAGELEVPKRDDSDSDKNAFFSEYLYDTTKGECAEGLSCVKAEGTEGEPQSCQTCHASYRDPLLAYLGVLLDPAVTESDYVMTAEETANMAKNVYTDAAGNTIPYICYSDVLATRVFLSAGAVAMAALTSMV